MRRFIYAIFMSASLAAAAWWVSPVGALPAAGLGSPARQPGEYQQATTPTPSTATGAAGASDGQVPVTQAEFGPWDLVTALDWSPDGQWIAAGAGEQIYLLDPETLEVQATIPGGELTHALDFSLDNRWLAAGSRDGNVRLWNLTKIQPGTPESVNEPERIWEAHRKGVNTVVFSPNSSLLATGGNDAVARLWNPESGELLGEIIGGTYAVPSVAFTPDGASLAIVNGDVVRLREIETGRISGTFYAEIPLFSIAFNPAGNIIASGDHENTLRLWDPAEAFRSGVDQYPEPLTLSGHSGKPGTFHALIWKLAFNPDGSRLASAGGDGTIRLWDPASGQLLQTLQAHRAAVTSLAYSPDGRWLATGSLDATVRLWQVGP